MRKLMQTDLLRSALRVMKCPVDRAVRGETARILLELKKSNPLGFLKLYLDLMGPPPKQVEDVDRQKVWYEDVMEDYEEVAKMAAEYDDGTSKTNDTEYSAAS